MTEKEFTLRAFLLGTILLFPIVLWIRQVELITFTCQITESIPPIPALAVLLLFAMLRSLMSKVGKRFPLTPGEQGTIFFFVALGCVMSAVGVTQAFLPYLTVPFYFASPENNYDIILRHLPPWFGPKDPEAIREFFEGSEAGSIPWAVWLKPLGLWTIFFLLYWGALTCLWSVMRKQWVERERLSFPLLWIPLSIIKEESPQPGQPPFFKDPLMWLGFSVSVIYNLLNILKTFNPAVPAPGSFYPIGTLFTERPWNAMAGLQMWHRPELVGLGYLVSTEILFSVWFFFLLHNLVAVAGRAIGWEPPGFPFRGEQGIGAYFAVALFLLWVARRHLRDVLRKALFGAKDVDDSTEPLPYRVAVFGFLLCVGGLLLWFKLAGMALWVGIFFLGLLWTVLLGYARIRAETGTPSIWARPHTQLREFPFYTFGSDAFKVGGSYKTLSVWTHHFFLVHGGFFDQSMVYQLEAFKLADELGVPRRKMVLTGFLALIVGLALAYWMFLTTYYEYGANVLAGGQKSVTGGVRIMYCKQSYDMLSGFVDNPRPPDLARNIATGVGFIVASFLIAVRVILLRSPFHPLGYIMASVIGHQLWWAFFMAWFMKTLILRLGGVRLYRRFIPAFLGLAIGHFFSAGIVWGSIATLWPGAIYIVWFT